MPRVAHAVLAVMLAVTGGCSPAPPTAAARSVASWAATAVMVGEAWLDRKVPRAYALRTLETAAKRVSGQSRAGGVEPIVAAIEHMRSAIERGADDEVRRVLAQLPR